MKSVSRLCLLIPVLWLFSGQTVLAIEVSGLYQGTVRVDSRESERERQRAFSRAMDSVLTRVTGRADLGGMAVIRRALGNADDYVDAWSYSTVSGSTVDGEETSFVELTVTFFEPEILRLLDAAGIAVWPSNRPETLVWIVIQDELEERRLLGAGTAFDRGLLDDLRRIAAGRGLPLLFPLLDFQDQSLISRDDVWDMNAAALRAASDRYQSESVLAIRLFRALSGEMLGRSLYLFRDRALEYDSVDDGLEAFLTGAINLAADELSSYYAVLLSGTDSSIEVNLTVEGVDSAGDYAGLLNYVSRLTDVNSYTVATVDASTIRLKLSTGGQLRQLVETIALGRRLVPMGELIRDENQVYMTYRWNEQ